MRIKKESVNYMFNKFTHILHTRNITQNVSSIRGCINEILSLKTKYKNLISRNLT